MIWAQWTLLGVGVVGVVVLVVLGLRLWRLLKAFAAMLSRASTTFAEMTAGLEAAQAARPGAAGGVHSTKSELKGQQ